MLLIFFDKCLLALALAIVAFFFNSELQREKARFDYQKAIFDKRVEGSLKLLEKVGTAHGELQFFYFGNISSPDAIGGALLWRNRLNDIRHRARELEGTTGGFGEGSTWTTPSAVVEAIEAVENARREYDFYLSSEINVAVDRFLHVMLSDLSEEMRIIGSEKAVRNNSSSRQKTRNQAERALSEDAWKRAQQACNDLRKLIRERLRLDGVVLG